MVSIWLIGAALAAPPASVLPVVLPDSQRELPKDDDKGSGSKAKTDSADRKGPGWETKLYAEPKIGAFVFSDGQQTSTGASIGAEAGLRYWQVQRPFPRLRGVARVAGDYVLTTSDASGVEARVGNFLGPYWQSVGLQTGPDLFWNRFTFGGNTLDPTIGLAWPVLARAWTKKSELSVYGGVEPAWLSNKDRRVDWSEQKVPGFGHEFTYRAGLGIRVGGLSLAAGYSYKITAFGGQHGISAGVAL